MSQDVKLSIIIPCYNSGLYLPEALQSISACADKETFEVIIVDDGSTDETTLSLLSQLKTKEYKVIHQNNMGPAAARNVGIAQASAPYILFLDSDNKIRPGYPEKALEVLNINSEIGVVYANPQNFGDSSRTAFKSQTFNSYALIRYNFIDMCSVIRKSVWLELGGLDENKAIWGHEDWEFWIRVAKAGWKFHYLNEILFDYRIRRNSLLEQAGQHEKYGEMLSYIYGKHSDFIESHYKQLYVHTQFYETDQSSPFRSFVKFCYHKYISPKKNLLG